MQLTYPPDVRLFRCIPREIGVYLPIPLSGRLDALVEIGKNAWAPAMRKEVMSALLLAANPEARWLRLVVARYKKAQVSNAFVRGCDDEFFLWPPEERGPRQLKLWNYAETHPDDVPPVTANEVLATAEEYRIGMPVPSPLAGRLDLLLQIVNERHQHTWRKDLIAALILDAPIKGSDLAAILHKYWHATVCDAEVPDHDTEPIYRIPSPSPPSRRRQRRRA